MYEKQALDPEGPSPHDVAPGVWVDTEQGYVIVGKRGAALQRDTERGLVFTIEEAKAVRDRLTTLLRHL